MHKNSKILFAKYAAPLIKSGMKVLEIGPDGFPSSYRKMVSDGDITWETIDLYESPLLTYSAVGEYRFPMSDNSYDIVLSGQVIEHVRKVWLWMRELSRVCKAGGLVVTINPVSWEYHEAPIDCWRIYPEGMKSLYDDAGLTMEMSKFESHESHHFAKEAIRRILGRRPRRIGPIIDTISIGRKR